MSLIHIIIFVLISVCNVKSCDVCSYLSCPVADLSNSNATTSYNDSHDSAGSGYKQQDYNYVLELSAGLYVPGDRITVKLLLTSCIEYDQNVVIGLSWYKIEVVYEQTGLEAPGEFSKLAEHSEASICKQNTIVFKACRPSVLDLPAKYYWIPSQESRGPICFKATVHHNLANSCEIITTCIPGNQDSNTVATSIPPTLKIVPGTLPTEPSPDRIKHCLEKWHCRNAKNRTFCGDNGVTYPTRCHMRRDECIYKIDITITSGACKPVVTASPTVPVPTALPTPIPYCEDWRKILETNNICKDDWLPQCTCTGQMKPVQCTKHHGRLECWCSTADGAEIAGTRRNITSHHSPTVYDLGCF